MHLTSLHVTFVSLRHTIISLYQSISRHCYINQCQDTAGVIYLVIIYNSSQRQTLILELHDLPLQDIRGLQEKMRLEIQETFTEVLSSIAKDPAKNTGEVSVGF